MTPRWKVLAPIDLTESSDTVVRYAIDAANALAAELVLVHVLEKRWYRSSRKAGWPPSALGKHSPDTDIHRLILSGAIPETIAEYADYIDADLLLFHRRRYSWGSLWQRSIADRVMELSGRPVCIANDTRADAGFGLDFDADARRVLAVVRFDGRDAPVIQQAHEIAIRSGSELVLLHVTQNMLPGADARAGDRLRDMSASLRVPARTSVMVGKLAECATLAAQEHGASLVVAGRETGRGSTRKLRSSLSRLPCPLITIALQDHVTDDAISLTRSYSNDFEFHTHS